MAEESEKRFRSIMDKLFYAPKPKPNYSSSSSGVPMSRGKKRQNSTSAARGDMVQGLHNSSVAEKSLQAPLCRPWDRGDLMKRLATFKSMTWFAKPKAVSAVNCATRGWVNVDMDTIACEACGARLLFSTPSSWTRQQVEKAALVFSLKLDNGHKLLCPWIDNACGETLAQFPPTPTPVLADGYRKRWSTLLKVQALPVISSSAIDYMRNPQLEYFLKQSPMQDCGSWSADTSQPKDLGNECEAVSSNLYYQAQKLISLSGWEPRSLPYVVDCKGLSNQSAKDENHLNLSHIAANGQNPTICVYSAGTDEIMEANEDPTTSGGLQSNPNSVVLDCKLCGASVGLWAFSTVPPPVELFRLVGYSEVTGENDSEDIGGPRTRDSGKENHVGSGEGVGNTSSNIATLSKDRLSNLNLTIAGGPPPTTQNFKATISLPIIGQNLRARFSSDSNFRDLICRDQENIPSGYQNKNSSQEGKDTSSRQVVQPEDGGLLKRKRHDDGHYISSSNDQLPCLNNNKSGKGDTLRNENNNLTFFEGMNVTGKELVFSETDGHDFVVESLLESTQNVAQGSGQNDKLPETETNIETVNPEVGDFSSSHVRDSSITTLGTSVATGSGETIENDDCNVQQVLGTDIVCCRELSIVSHQESSCVASSLVTSVTVDDAFKIDLKNGKEGSVGQKTSAAQNMNQEGDGVKDRVQIPVNNEGASGIAMAFDPIRQHRHFCPWITSTGSASPGWQQTLSALLRQKEFSHHLLTEPPSFASVIEVDDPIASVRKLFMSPSAKRMKPTHGSS